MTFAGTRGLVGFRLVSHLAEKVSALPSGSTILLRRGRTTQPGTFEQIIDTLAQHIGLKVEYRLPIEGDRAGVYKRDYAMVDDSDYVEAYFPASAIMEGGTGHVVEAALAREKRVYAWSVDYEGRISRVGELEPAPVD